MLMANLILLATLWWLLAGGEPTSWLIGAPSVGAAWLVRKRVAPMPTWKISLTGGVRYLLSFFKVSLVSGIDVARRAFHPRLPITPGLVEYQMRLTSSAEKHLVAGTVNLLPGTLSANLDQNRLTVHALDLTAPILLAFLLLLSIVIGLSRIFLGPTAADRILAIQLSGTGGVAVLLVLSKATDRGALLDVVLVYALLAAVTQIAFVKIYSSIPRSSGKEEDD
jgi:multicomponent Na+:H+ antiporter subunit E